jgi:ABC-type bacteriocin/lantibiotic exporter with double-glycine peptidase domain
MVGLILPFLTKMYIDEVLPTHDTSLMHALVFAVAACTIASSLMGTLRGLYTQAVSGELTTSLSLMFFNHLQHKPVSFFDTHRVGEIMSRFTDVRSSLASVSRILEAILLNGVYVALVPVVMVAINVKLSLLALCALPITAALSVYTSRRQRVVMKATAEVSADLSAFQFEALTQVRTVKLAAAENTIFQGVADRSSQVFSLQLRSGLIAAGVAFLNTIVRTAGVAGYTWYGWTLILRNELTLGEFIACSSYLGLLSAPVTQMTALFADFQRSAVALGRMFEYLDLPTEMDPEQAYSPPATLIHRIRGPLELCNVSYGYAEGKNVLDDVSCVFPAGAITAIVGASGAGKSTIVRLLARMGAPRTGTLRANGTSFADIPLQDFRRQVAVVWQEVGLMRGTIWDNLTLGVRQPSRKTVASVIDRCRLSEVIMGLPNGYETQMAECGATLSGGQRQRIALARAILRETPVLILDEATSNIDVGTEGAILEVIADLYRDKTVVIVTHRAATAALSSTVVYLSSGRVDAFAPHETLLVQNRSYEQMWSMSDRPVPVSVARVKALA